MKRVDGLAGLLNVSAKGIWDSAIRKQSNNYDTNLNHSTVTRSVVKNITPLFENFPDRPLNLASNSQTIVYVLYPSSHST